MSTFEVDDTDVRRLFRRLRRKAPAVAEQALDDSAAKLHERLVNDILNRVGSGRLYPSRSGSGTHRASAPGEPPAPDTHEYRESWRVGSDRKGRAVYTEDRRGPWLEFGTVRIEPRPHASVAANAHTDDHREAVEAAMRRLEQQMRR